MTTFKEPMFPSRTRQKATLKSDTDRLPKKKRKVERPFILQRRYAGNELVLVGLMGEWHSVGKCETAEQAESNMDSMIRKFAVRGKKCWEFRIIDKRKQVSE